MYLNELFSLIIVFKKKKTPRLILILRWHNALWLPRSEGRGGDWQQFSDSSSVQESLIICQNQE